MFSQCPKCETAFRVTPEQLQQANGKVRCGKCQHVYNALNPAEETQTTAASESRPEWLNDPEEQRALEIEAELDEIERSGQQPVLADTQAEEDLAADSNLQQSAEELAVDEATATDLPEMEALAETVTADLAVSDDETTDVAKDFVGNQTLTADDIAEILADSDEDLLASGVSNDDFFDDDDEDIDSGTIVMIDDDEDEDARPDSIDSEELAEAEAPFTIDSFDDDSEIAVAAEDDTLVPDEPLAKSGDDLEFNVPKQQWGKFFAGRYEGPIIEPVGPLDDDSMDAEIIDYDIDQDEDDSETDAGIDLTQSIEPGMIGFDVDDMLNPESPSINDDNDDDEALDDLEGLLEEESEALQTYSDLNRELANDDIDEASDNDPDHDTVDSTIVADEADTITAEPDAPPEAADEETATNTALRSAIDTLSMEKAEWQRLLEAADNDPSTQFVVENDELTDDQHTETGIEALADSETPDTDDEFDSEDDDDYESIVLSSEDSDEDNEQAPGDAVIAALNKPTAADLAATPLWLKDVPEEPEVSGNKRWLAAGGVLIALLLLGSQLIHHNREALATDPNYGETVRKVYEVLDRPLYPAWELSAYKIRSSEAIYGESTQDFLDIRAQLAVTGDRPMGEPEIKVILKDRWGNPVNTWLFTPDQYMQGMRPPNGLIQPGTLIPITLSVLDTGNAAQGFQLAVCLRREGGVLQCDGQL